MTDQLKACREAFEKWVADSNFSFCVGRSGDGYEYHAVNDAWETWQASWNTRAQAEDGAPRCGTCDGVIRPDALTGTTCACAQTGEAVADEVLRAEWSAAGGSAHGPNVETVTMPEADYFRFRRMLASNTHPPRAQGDGEDAPEKLWALHMRGPDDVVAAPSKIAADVVAKNFNDYWEQHKHLRDHDVHVIAAVIEWPFEPARHAKAVMDDFGEYTDLLEPFPLSAQRGEAES